MMDWGIIVPDPIGRDVSPKSSESETERPEASAAKRKQATEKVAKKH